MMRAVVALLLVCTTVAYAGPRQVLVLRAEGSADVASRTNVDTHVLRLAKHIDGKIDAGDITLSDAAAAAGCNPTDAACKDEIVMTFGVDEIVATTVTSSNGQLSITVQRFQKGSARSAASRIPAGKAPDAKLDADLGPLFGLAATATPAAATTEKTTEKTTDKATDKTTDKTSDKTSDKPVKDATPPATTTPPPSDQSPVAEPPPTSMMPPQPAQPQPQPQPAPEGAPRRTWEKVGMGVGLGVTVLGVILWSAAAAKQKSIDDAPTSTPADFKNLQALENDADGLAGGGNLLFVGGLLIGGVSAYLYWRAGRHSHTTQSAQLAPAVFPHGAGVVFTFGGAP